MYQVGDCCRFQLRCKPCFYQPALCKLQVMLRRFYRPEDISRDSAYTAEFTDVYESEETLAVPLDDVVSKCSVLAPGQPITGEPARAPSVSEAISEFLLPQHHCDASSSNVRIVFE